MNIEVAVNSLGEIVRKQEEIFEKIMGKYNKKSEEIPMDHLQIILLFRKVTENLDSLFILLDNSLENTSESIARNLFESFLFLKYMADCEEKSKERARAYHYGHLLNQVDLAETILSKKNRLVIKEYIDVDKESSELKKRVRKLQESMNSEENKNISVEWKIQQKRQNSKYIQWYSLFKGPVNLRALATKCGYEAEYLLMYKLFSYQVHTTNAFNQLEVVGGLGGIKNLRIREKSEMIIPFVRVLGFAAMVCVYDFFNLDEKGKIYDWYQNLNK